MKRGAIVLASGLLVAAGWCLFAESRLGRELEWRLYDFHMRLRPPRPWTAPAGPTDGDGQAKPVRIIVIDSASIDVLGTWAWPRDRHALLLQVLSHPAYRPRAIGYDVAFLQRDAEHPEGDAALAEILSRLDNVCLGYHFEESRGEESASPDAEAVPRAREDAHSTLQPAETRPAVPQPLDRMRLRCPGDRPPPGGGTPQLPWPELSAAAWLGLINAPQDDDGVLRRLPLMRSYRNGVVPSLALAVVLRALNCRPADAEVVPGRWVVVTPPAGFPVRIPIDESGCALINFPGRWETADVTSFVDVLGWASQVQDDGTARDEKERRAAARALAAFKDAVVFVGMDYSLVPDVLATPLDGVCPGVGVHAAMAQGLLAGAPLCACPPWLDIALVAALSLAGAALATWPATRWGVPGVMALLAGAWGAGFGAFALGRVLSTAAPLLAGATSFAALTVFRQLVTERHRRRIKHLFGQYLSPEAVEEILQHADHLALGGRRMEAVVLFSDLRGFTALTERLGAAAIVEVLNEYFEAMTEIIQEHGGAVNKFVGDEIFATFGVPLPHPDDALRAVQAAVEMQQRLAAMRRAWADRGRPQLEMGIGISRGEVVAGTIGSERRKDYTAIGDAVNLGARLQELTKEFRRPILVCRAIWDDVNGRVAGRSLEKVPIRGRSQPVEVYAIDVPD